MKKRMIRDSVPTNRLRLKLPASFRQN